MIDLTQGRRFLASLLLPLLFFAGAAQGADLTQREHSTNDAGLTSTAFDKKIRDSGDGTHAEVVSLTSTAYSVSVTNTRPANTTTYAATDVVGGTPTAVLTFASIGPSGGRIEIIGSSLEIDVAAVPSGMTSFRLHLYSVTPPSALADDAAWDLPAGDRASYLGYIDLGTPADLGSTLYVQDETVRKPIKLATGSTTIYGYLVSNGAYVATSAAVKVITLHAVAL
jgi:hypothetical protein